MYEVCLVKARDERVNTPTTYPMAKHVESVDFPIDDNRLLMAEFGIFPESVAAKAFDLVRAPAVLHFNLDELLFSMVGSKWFVQLLN